jgi:hypothetical protein
MANAPSHLVPGAPPPASPLARTLSLVAAALILSLLCALLSVVSSLVGRPRNRLWSVLPATAALLVGLMGLTAWTPFGSFPQLAYTWSNGPLELSFRSGWLFLAPLSAAVVALCLTAWQHRRRPPAL